MSAHHQQLAFDFEAAERERPITEHFARLDRLARERNEWSEDNLCLAWCTQSDGMAWRDWWGGLSNYERASILASYRCERAIADAIGRGMRPFSIYQISDEEIAAERSIIEFFKREIVAAAVDGRPMPLKAGEHMTPLELLTFKHRLERAMRESGVVIVKEHQA